MIRKKEIQEMMDALMLKHWGIVSIDENYRSSIGRHLRFEIHNSLLDALPETNRTVIAIAVPYELKNIPVSIQNRNQSVYGKIEPFSWEYDYHRELKQILHEITIRLENQFEIASQNVEICVDTSPYNDKEVGFLTGLGRVGHNHLLIHDVLGTSFFIGYIVYPFTVRFEEGVLTEIAQLPATIAHPFCENCNLCQRVCPTEICDGKGAENMNRCLSSLTQTKEDIDPFDYPKFSNHLYGCSICQNVCPLANRTMLDGSKYNSENRLLKITTSNWVDCYELLQMSKITFLQKFGQMGFAWRNQWIYKRNALIVIGNTGGSDDYEKLLSLSDYLKEERLRIYYDWALNELKSKKIESK